MEAKRIQKFITLLTAVLLVMVATMVFQTHQAEAKDPDLVIYAYDSFVSEWGPGPIVIPKFEKLYNVKVSMISGGDAGQVLNRAILEKNRPRADIILGIDNNLLAKAIGAGILVPYRSKNLSRVPEELIFDKTYHLTPFDHGFFAIVYDSEKLKDPPKNFEELTSPKYRNMLILEDPRTSSPGFGFLLWTIAVYGENFTDYWKRLRPNILTITEGWDTAYGLFTSGEAPMVLSYTTSPAYHVQYENTTRYRAIIFEEGNYLQIEGMGILKGAKHIELAKNFLDFILTEDFQKEIPLTNWMFPVIRGIELPASFKYAPKPDKILSLDSKDIENNQRRWISEWLRIVSE